MREIQELLKFLGIAFPLPVEGWRKHTVTIDENGNLVISIWKLPRDAKELEEAKAATLAACDGWIQRVFLLEDSDLDCSGQFLARMMEMA